MAKTRLHGIVSGRVQGVGFRAFVRRTAMEFDLTGWVRNCWDGTVEFTAEGEKHLLEQMLHVIQTGNRFSHVNNVEFDWGDPQGYRGFEIEY